MSISDKQGADVDCEDVEDTWAVISDVLEFVMDELPNWDADILDVSNAYELRHIGRLAASEALFSQFVDHRKSNIAFWRTEGHELISHHMQQDSAVVDLKLTKSQGDFIAEQAFLEGSKKIRNELAKMKSVLAEIHLDMETWGAEKPVEARYKELVKVRRSYNKKFLKYLAWAVFATTILGYWLYEFSAWLIAIPAFACLAFIYYVLNNWALATGELAGGDSELQEWAKQHNKQL